MRRIFILMFLFVVGVSFSYAQTNAVVPDGEGTEADPYEIATLGNLSWVTQNAASFTAETFFRQTADIDASETVTWDDADDNSDGDLFNDEQDMASLGNNEGWLPIASFYGTYDGNSFKITGLTIDRASDNIGFFDVALGTIKDLGLENISYTASGENVGSLAGNFKEGSINSCYTTGTISANNTEQHYNYGGMVGRLTSGGSITDSYSEVDITDDGSGDMKDVGGFVGYADSGTKAVSITNCYSRGTVAGYSRVAGFIGYIKDVGKITKCYSTGDASGVKDDVGGFVGAIKDSGMVSECYSLGNVSGGQETGGFLGYLLLGSVVDCYSFGSVTCNGGDDCGGFVGEIDGGTLSRNYSTGEMLLTGRTDQGFCGDGNSAATCVGNYWDTETSGQSDTDEGKGDDGASGKTTVEMKLQSTFEHWDFKTTWESNANYPNLLNNSNPALEVPTAVGNSEPLTTVSSYELEQNYPNPFNPTTAIKFSLKENSNVTLTVYNVQGQKVAVLANGKMSAGQHSINFNASNLASGVYIYRLSSDNYIATKRMILLK